MLAALQSWDGELRSGGTLTAQQRGWVDALHTFHTRNVTPDFLGYSGAHIVGSRVPGTSGAGGTDGLFNGRVRGDGLVDTDSYHTTRNGLDYLMPRWAALTLAPDPRLVHAITHELQAHREAYRVGHRNTVQTGPDPSPYRCQVHYQGTSGAETGRDYRKLEACKEWQIMEFMVRMLRDNQHLTPPTSGPLAVDYRGAAKPANYYALELAAWEDLLENHFVPKWRGGGTSDWRVRYYGDEPYVSGSTFRNQNPGEIVVFRRDGHPMVSSMAACYMRYLNTGIEGYLAKAKDIFDHIHGDKWLSIVTPYGTGLIRDAVAASQGTTIHGITGYTGMQVGTLVLLKALGFYPEKLTDAWLTGIVRTLRAWWLFGTDSSTTGRGIGGNASRTTTSGVTLNDPNTAGSWSSQAITHQSAVGKTWPMLMPWDDTSDAAYVTAFSNAYAVRGGNSTPPGPAAPFGLLMRSLGAA